MQSATFIYGIAFDNAGTLFAGGNISTSVGFAPGDYIVKWDGGAWSAVQAYPRITKEVHALACDAQGNLFAGGLSVPAKWTGTNWAPLGAGMGVAIGIAKILALALDGHTNLYAGGLFGSIDGVTAYNLARWNGSSWSDLGFGGPNAPTVNALALDSSGNLYEGGGDVQVWNGITWSNLGASGTIYSLAFDSVGNLYAGGSIAAGPVSDHIIKWDGNDWSTMGAGLNSDVYTIVTDKFGNIYAGGEFTLAGSVPVPHVAKWDGTSWSSLGAGLTDAVIKLVIDPFGNLFAVGRFQTSAGLSLNRVAKWDGTTWSPLGSGLNKITYAVAEDGANHLYVGGAFTTAGTNYSAYVAQANLLDSLGAINIAKIPNGVSMSLQGRPGSSCVLESSTNLTVWSPVSTNICGMNGLWSFTNTVTAVAEFFRAVLP